MRCHVYRCCRSAGTYLYLAERDALDRLPEPLRSRLGAFEFVLEFVLDETRRLPREDPAVVRGNLAAQGFHLQFPPAHLHDQPHAAA
jgi:uncharacterized protein